MKIPRQHYLIILGIISLLFFIIWLFTCPALYAGFDYSASGNIGDTIGGITAPIIGITGAYLVYVSFEAQLKANKMQFDALNEEKKRYEKDRWLQQHQSVLDDVKQSVKDFELMAHPVEMTGNRLNVPVFYKGINAFVQLILYLEGQKISITQHYYYSPDGIYYSVKYTLANISDLLKRIEKDSIDTSDKVFIKENVKSFYENVLSTLVHRYISCLTGNRHDKIKELTDNINFSLQKN